MLGAINVCFQLINIVTENLLIFTVFGKKKPKNENSCSELQNNVPRIFFLQQVPQCPGIDSSTAKFCSVLGMQHATAADTKHDELGNKKLLYMDTTYGSFSEQNSPGSLLHRGQHSHWPYTFSLPPPQYRYLLLEGHQKIKATGTYIIDMVTNNPYPQSV